VLPTLRFPYSLVRSRPVCIAARRVPNSPCRYPAVRIARGRPWELPNGICCKVGDCVALFADLGNTSASAGRFRDVGKGKSRKKRCSPRFKRDSSPAGRDRNDGAGCFFPRTVKERASLKESRHEIESSRISSFDTGLRFSCECDREPWSGYESRSPKASH